MCEREIKHTLCITVWVKFHAGATIHEKAFSVKFCAQRGDVTIFAVQRFFFMKCYCIYPAILCTLFHYGYIPCIYCMYTTGIHYSVLYVQYIQYNVYVMY